MPNDHDLVTVEKLALDADAIAALLEETEKYGDIVWQGGEKDFAAKYSLAPWAGAPFLNHLRFGG